MNLKEELQNLFLEIQTHLLEDERPSEYLKSIENCPTLNEHPFIYLKKLQLTEQSPLHHPEGNVWNHTLLVVDKAASEKSKSNHPLAFMWAALLHDIGKPFVTRVRKGKITSYAHDKAGQKFATEFLSFFNVSKEIIRQVSALVLYHMQILFVLKDMPFADISGMKRDTDIKEIALLGLCDRLGRKSADIDKEYENIELFIKKCGISK